MMAHYAGLEGASSAALNWESLNNIVRNVAQARYVPRELASQWKERLKSESTQVVLNTLTALHTLSLNGGQQVRDQIALSKCLKHLDRLLNRPPFPGVETAAAQLLMDWAFLYGGEELGLRSFNILTSTSRHRAMLQAMQASTVAVMLREDQKIVMPQFITVRKGLDFAKQFTSAQYGSPLTGVSSPPGVLDFLAKAAVAASYSGSSTAAAAAAAASRNTFAAWAERVQQDPAAAAERVLSARQLVEADIQSLAAAQAACLAAARPFLNKSAHGSSSSKRSNRDCGDQYSDLRNELDKAYLVACKCTEWREMIQVLLQHQLPDIYTSALLALADTVNATLEEWQAAATTEIFWLLGVDTAGLADGSSLVNVLVSAQLAPAATAAASSSSTQQQQQQQRRTAGAASAAAAAAGVTRGSYLDLLSGDSIPLSSSDHVSNPFLTDTSVAVADSTTTPNPFATVETSPPPPAAAAAAAVRSSGIPPELQCYIQEATAAAPTSLPAAAAAQPPPAAAAAAGVSGYPAIAATAYPAAVGGPVGTSGVGPRYHAVANSAVQPWQQQQQQHRSATHTLQPEPGISVPSAPAAAAAGQILLQQQAAQVDSLVNSSSTQFPSNSNSSNLAGFHMAAAAASGSANITAAAAAAAGDTGSSADSPVSHSYINPFAALDTNKIISQLKLTSPRSSSDGAAIISASSIASSAAAVVKLPVRSSSTGDAAGARQQQQQQHVGMVKKREPPPPPSAVAELPPVAAAAAAAGVAGSTAAAHSMNSSNIAQTSYAEAQQRGQALQQQQQQQLVHGSTNQQKHTASAAAVAATSSSSMVTQVPQSLSPRRQQQQQQQQSLLSLQEIEVLQHKLHQVLSSVVTSSSSNNNNNNNNSSSSSSSNASVCQSCGVSSTAALQSALLQFLVQQEQQHKQQLLLMEQQHKQEVKRVKEMALDKLREMQQQLAHSQQLLREAQQPAEQQQQQ